MYRRCASFGAKKGSEESDYIRKALGNILVTSLAEVATKRPSDPIEYLAKLLYHFAKLIEENERLEVDQDDVIIEMVDLDEQLQVADDEVPFLPAEPSTMGRLSEYSIEINTWPWRPGSTPSAMDLLTVDSKLSLSSRKRKRRRKPKNRSKPNPKHHRSDKKKRKGPPRQRKRRHTNSHNNSRGRPKKHDRRQPNCGPFEPTPQPRREGGQQHPMNKLYNAGRERRQKKAKRNNSTRQKTKRKFWRNIRRRNRRRNRHKRHRKARKRRNKRRRNRGHRKGGRSRRRRKRSRKL